MATTILIGWAAIVFAILWWMLLASVNARLAWRRWIRREQRVPSVFPLVGGLLGAVLAYGGSSCPACPLYGTWSRHVMALAMIGLDIGCGPFLAVSLLDMIRHPDRYRRN
jgi:hypothetical protein